MPEPPWSVAMKSVLAQTYPNIEVIAVDDGSTDHTADILKKYRPIFKEHRMCLRYMFEPNAGLGAAIHLGLQYVTGDYLCWSDPDDFYFPESMKKRWLAFQAHPECAVVSSDAFVFSSDDLHHPIKREAARFEHRYDPKQFEWLLTEKSHFCAGCHMIRMKDFLKVNPQKYIYPARRGQETGNCCFLFITVSNAIIWMNLCMLMFCIRTVCPPEMIPKKKNCNVFMSMKKLSGIHCQKFR